MADGETSFFDLNLLPGDEVFVIPDMEKPSAVSCMYVGCIPDETLILTVSESGEFPVVTEGQEAFIKVYFPKGIALLTCQVLFVGEVPLPMIFADYPKTIQTKEVRRESRVDVMLPVLVSNVSQGKNRGIPGQVMDLSKSGARLQLDRPLGKVGDKIQLKGKFDVAGIRRILDLRGVIRSFPKSDAGLNGIQCGVEFVENHEDKLLVLYGYISYTSSYGNIQSVR